MADALSWPDLIARLLAGETLSAQETAWAMDQVMAGDATPVQVAGFLVALRARGETAEEMSGLVAAMLSHAHRIDVPGPVVDVVGTGGDRAHTVNLSTMAALVVAGTGARVVKHGNRAASSACGSADVLEELGVTLTLAPQQVRDVALEAGITFCFAQVFHPAMRHAAVPRRELGVPTAFNFLGPLTNPAQPEAQAVGCADARMAEVMAGVFAQRGVRALVVRGDDGLDEVTTATTTTVWDVREGDVSRHVVEPGDLGCAGWPAQDLVGGDRAHNAAVVRALLDGSGTPAVHDAVVLNAAAALAALSPSGTLHERLTAGADAARASLAGGAAQQVLQRWVASTAVRA